MKLKKLGLFRKLPNRFFVSKAKEAESGGSSSIENLTLDFNNSSAITLTDEQIDILLNTNPLVVSIKNFKNSVYEGDSAAIKTKVTDGQSHHLITFNRFFSWFGQSSGSTWYGNNTIKQCIEELQINKTTKEARLMQVAHMSIPNLDKEKFDELYAPKKYLHCIHLRGYDKSTQNEVSTAYLIIKIVNQTKDAYTRNTYLSGLQELVDKYHSLSNVNLPIEGRIYVTRTDSQTQEINLERMFDVIRMGISELYPDNGYGRIQCDSILMWHADSNTNMEKTLDEDTTPGSWSGGTFRITNETSSNQYMYFSSDTVQEL